VPASRPCFSISSNVRRAPREHDLEKHALGLDPRVETGFPKCPGGLEPTGLPARVEHGWAAFGFSHAHDRQAALPGLERPII
jgi:hypothetical protein